MNEKLKIISKDFYSNCLIEAVKAKLKNWENIKITYVSPFSNEVFCPHILWSDGHADYDFGTEGKSGGILNYILYKGHIRQRKLGYNEKYKNVCKEWRKKQKRQSIFTFLN